MNPFASLNANFSQERLNQFMQMQKQMNSRSSGPAPAPVAGPQRGKGGTITSLISEGGALGGAAAGAAAGSVVPVVGTAIGGIVGAGLGAFAGRVAENKVRDDRLGLGDAAKEGAVSAVLSGPLKALKYGGTAAKGIAAGGGLEKALIEAAEGATKFSLRGSAANAVGKKANDLATKQFGLTDNFLAKFSQKYGEDAGKIVQRYGFSNADDVTNQVAKQNDIFNKLVEGTGSIKKARIESKLTNVAEDLLNQGPSQKKALGEKLLSETQQLLSQFDDEIPATALNQIRKQYDDLVTYTMKQNDPATYGVNKRVADVLRKTAQDASGSTQLKETGHEISKLIRLGEEIGLREPAVSSRAASPLGLRNMVGGLIGATGGGAVGGIPGAVAGMGLTMAANSPTGRKTLFKGAEAGAKGLTKLGGGGATPLGMALKTGITQPAEGMINNSQSAEAMSLEDALMSAQGQGSVNQTQSPVNTMNTNTVNMPQSYNNTLQQSSANPYSKENLLADIQKDPANSAKYIAYYSQLEEIFNPAQEQMKAADMPYSRPSAAQYSQGVAGMQAVDSIEQMYGQDPGLANKSAIPGQRLPGVGGLVSKAAGTSNYRGASNSVLNSIARINTGANMPESEREFYEMTYLPQPGDDPNTVQQKMMRLRSFFQPIVSYSGSGGGGLEDALMSAQSGAF